MDRVNFEAGCLLRVSFSEAQGTKEIQNDLGPFKRARVVPLVCILYVAATDAMIKSGARTPVVNSRVRWSDFNYFCSCTFSCIFKEKLQGLIRRFSRRILRRIDTIPRENCPKDQFLIFPLRG